MNGTNSQNNVFRITVKVKPKSSKQKIILCDDGSLKVHLHSPPEDGKANEELIAYLAEILRISRTAININSGLKSKTKILELSGINKKIFNSLILKNMPS